MQESPNLWWEVAPPAINDSELTEQDVVSEYTIAESTGGRKPVIFRLNYDKLYVVGIQLVRDRVALGLCDLKGRILTKRSFQPYSLEPRSLVAELSKEFELLLGMNGINREHILGSGLAISGIVNADAGILLRSVNLGWRDVRISETLEEALGFPVVVENDANAAALAELWFGCARDVSNFMYLKTDTGVGAGIVCGGSLMAGPRGMAGEIGHAPLIKDGRECVCGQRGCLETYLYAQGLLRRYEAETGVHLEQPRDFFERIVPELQGAAFEAVRDAVLSGRISLERVERSVARIRRWKQGLAVAARASSPRAVAQSLSLDDLGERVVTFVDGERPRSWTFGPGALVLVTPAMDQITLAEDSMDVSPLLQELESCGVRCARVRCSMDPDPQEIQDVISLVEDSWRAMTGRTMTGPHRVGAAAGADCDRSESSSADGAGVPLPRAALVVRNGGGAPGQAALAAALEARWNLLLIGIRDPREARPVQAALSRRAPALFAYSTESVVLSALARVLAGEASPKGVIPVSM